MDEGDQRQAFCAQIRCASKNCGLIYLEAFPKADVVRPRPVTDTQDQIWQFHPSGPKGFKIKCLTQNRGARCLESSLKDDVIRLLPENNTKEQLWFVETLGKFSKIYCSTGGSGT